MATVVGDPDHLLDVNSIGVSMPDIQIVKVDEGGVNARILAKEAKADFRRVEAARPQCCRWGEESRYGATAKNERNSESPARGH